MTDPLREAWRERCREYFVDFQRRFPDLQLLYSQTRSPGKAHFACMKGYAAPVYFCAAVPGNHNAGRTLSVAFDIPAEWCEKYSESFFQKTLVQAGVSLLEPNSLVYRPKPIWRRDVVRRHLTVRVEWPADIIESRLWPEFQAAQADMLLRIRPVVDQVYPPGSPRVPTRR